MKFTSGLSIVIGSLIIQGCAAPALSPEGAKIRTFVGEAVSCSELGEVKGFRGDSGGPNDRAGFNRIMNQSAELGANSLRFSSGTDQEFKGFAYSCTDREKVTYVAVQYIPKIILGNTGENCIEVGGVETTAASSQNEAKEILAKRARIMGANTVRLKNTASATAFYCK